MLVSPVMRTMRTTIAMALSLAVAGACSKSANEGAEEARKQAEKEQKEKEATGGTAKKISPPVAGGAKLSCADVLKPDLMTQALGEAEPVSIADASKDVDAAATCDVLRGGTKLTEAQQKAKLKEEGVLGVMAGEPLCNVSLYCYTIEDAERFRAKCASDKSQSVDDSLGFAACKRTIITGKWDVNHWRFFDDDTKCIIQVRAGASNTDNDLINKCAKAAHDLIGPNEIKVGGGGEAPAEKPAEAAGSAG